MELTVQVNSEDNSTYWAQVRELPGCFASGASLDELLEALSESVSLYLADETREGETPAERPLTLGEMKVLA